MSKYIKERDVRLRRKLELHTIIWYQDDSDSIDPEIVEKMRQEINSFIKFTSMDEFQRYFADAILDDNCIFLIVATNSRDHLLSEVHGRKEIAVVFLFSKNVNETDASYLTSKFNKIKGSYAESNELINAVVDEQRRLIQLEDLELATDVLNRTQSTSTTNDRANFIWFRLLIDALMKIEDHYLDADLSVEYQQQNPGKILDFSETKVQDFRDQYVRNIPVRQFVNTCRQHFEGNQKRLALLAEFEATYSSSQSIVWFTQEPFIFRVLNKALRYQQIDILYQYRFLIRDIAEQLSTKHHTEGQDFHVYRGQVLNNEDFNRIAKPETQFVRFNSFLSTSRDEDIARAFAISSMIDASNQTLVLFDIEISTQVSDVLPYADISEISRFPDEKEILFMCGSVFRMIQVTHKQSEYYTIELRLCSEQDEELRMTYHDLQQEYLSDARNISLIDLGNILKDTNREIEAGKYYFQLMNVVEDGNPLIQRCLHNLALLRYKLADYNEALQYLQWALDLEVASVEREESFVCSIYNWIGNVYFMKNDFNQALENYEGALKHHSRLDSRDDLGEIKVHANIANIYTCQQRYELALEKHKECLTLKRKLFQSSQHSTIAASYVNIGIIYTKLKHHQPAIDSFHNALDIQRNVFNSKHCDVGVALYNLARVYSEQGNYSLAYDYYLQAIENFPSHHHYFRLTQLAINETKSKIMIS